MTPTNTPSQPGSLVERLISHAVEAWGDLEDDLLEAASRIAELERERDEALSLAKRDELLRMNGQLRERAQSAEAALLALREKIGDVEGMAKLVLNARVPGGSEVAAWLPQKDAWTPHQTALDICEAVATALRNHLLGEGKKT